MQTRGEGIGRVLARTPRGPRGAGGREAALEYGVGTRGYSRYRPGHWSAMAAAALPRAARAVLSCAGAYVAGSAGRNVCPAVSARIETEAACRTAAAATGKTPYSTFLLTSSDLPRGCYYNTGDNVAYFNDHAVGGSGYSDYRLLCAVTTGAPIA
jgi:hypothetical protein